jgi:hypothetical protein
MGKADVVSYSPAALGLGHRLSEHFTLGEFMSKGADGSEPTPVDMELVAMLEKMRGELSLKTGRDTPVSITSGYRTPAHNRAMGSEDGSFHTMGMAADARFYGVPAETVAQCAQWAGARGIGLYPDFVHIDTRDAPYCFRKPGQAEIPVPGGFPGYVPADRRVHVKVLCRCGGTVVAELSGILLADGLAYAPVRPLCEALGHSVDWDGANVTVRP